MRISDWSSDVCSSDLRDCLIGLRARFQQGIVDAPVERPDIAVPGFERVALGKPLPARCGGAARQKSCGDKRQADGNRTHICPYEHIRSEAHTPELQSLMGTSYAVFFLKKKNK